MNMSTVATESMRVPKTKKAEVIFFILFLQCTTLFIAAFHPSPLHAATTMRLVTSRGMRLRCSTTATTLFRPRKIMASEGFNDEALASTTMPSVKKRKRKDGNKFDPPRQEVLEGVPESKINRPTPKITSTPKENVVVMNIRDIRDIVSGTEQSTLGDQRSQKNSLENDDIDYDHVDDEDELAEDEEWEYFDVDENGNEIIASNERVGREVIQDNSIDQLLADARQMRSAKSSSSRDQGGIESSSSTKDTVFEVVSTIMTIDFFVVIGLLAWFLLGIFCSSVLHNDAVQIAFNMNFERVTQPALGILMIGSVAGALGNKDDKE